ncbi:MAG TPA: HAMP domain-containing sensor histidine kinase [Gemmataceae bacterium]|nr:HAMP domain-containing sensor histidine kinase [Gemmataceae bacterium]
MRHPLRGKPGGLAAFIIIAALVAGGLGWATAAALGLEREQLEQRVRADLDNRLRLALRRLDALILPELACENSRPFNHYSAVYAVPVAFDARGLACPAGAVREPSPLLSADLPAWMRLHFMADAVGGWESPQVPTPAVDKRLKALNNKLALDNVTNDRKQLLDRLSRALPAASLLDQARRHARETTLRDTTLLEAWKNPGLNNSITYPNGGPQQAVIQNGGQPQAQMPVPPDYLSRLEQQSKVLNDSRTRGGQRYDRNSAMNNFKGGPGPWAPPGKDTLPAGGTEVEVSLSPMVRLWLPVGEGGEELVALRLVHVDGKEFCQGIVLDAAKLQALLVREVEDLFPDARLVPVHEEEPSEQTMASLPYQLDPGPDAAPAVADPGWTPLRVGLACAWLAALVALLAVGLGGWSLLDLSERRIRFVSAVTHELRTPLTTLRLYLDMLMSGLVRDETQKQEYIRTLHAEADRLNRLVGNVLDFSRLENQRPRLNRAHVAVADLLAGLRATWQGRCQDAEKELIVESDLPPGAALWTDGELVQQVLGNLLDNACKYSRGAEDRRLWLRARAEGRRLMFEVEDRGPGVPPRERRLIFRAFRRGGSADVTAGGVGLGLALARRWTELLGGELTLRPTTGGACFRLSLPADGAPIAEGKG